MKTILALLGGICLSMQVIAQPLLETQWRLLTDQPSSANVASLQLGPNQRLSGSDGCNRLLGKYALDGERLSFSNVAGTRMACPAMQGREAAFGAALMRVNGWRIRGGVLELTADGAPVLRFKADAASGTSQDCAAPTTQADMNRCAHEDFLAATAEYSAAYKAVSDALPTLRRNLFRSAQTAWVRYRTAFCNFESSGAQGGSVQPMVKSQCDARMTRERTAELRALNDCKEGDVTCVRPKQ